MNKTTEALKLAEAVENDAKEHREVSYGLDCPPERTANWKHALNCEAAARLIREALAEPVKQAPVAWHDKIKGMEVSVDVSTGEDDAHHRVFGRVDSVMLESCGAQEDIIPVIEESRNYAAPVSAKREWIDLTDDEIMKINVDTASIVPTCDRQFHFARAVIAADREKNK